MMDPIVRVGYRVVYRAARLFWFIARPHTSSAVVALWAGGRVLLVRTSYRPHYGLPGGFLKRGETADAAALRELVEETGLKITVERLQRAWHGEYRFENRYDTITIFEAALDSAPDVRATGRELVWTGWKTPGEALELLLAPHVRDYLAVKSAHSR
jgi:8-oxo-dGTP diphosphatase